MDKLLAVLAFVKLHGLEILGAVDVILGGLIAIALLVPGEQPEKALGGVKNFIAKFSKK